MKNTLFRDCITLVVQFLISANGFCQNSPFNIEGIYKKNIVSTPDMAALAKNIVYPVNHSTGTVEIKIPLYEIKCGSLSLPIYLTYNTGGVKVQDASGWVGQGWSLFATPAISRAIQGHLDSQFTCNFNENGINNPEQKYYHVLDLLNDDVFSSQDEQPDEYYYKLADKSGMFIYAKEPKISGMSFLPIPYDDIKIKNNGSYFTITDNDGTKYVFNGGSDISNIQGYCACGWRPSTMVSASEIDSICFEYGNQVITNVNRHEDFITVVDAFTDYYRYGAHSYNQLNLGSDYPPDLEELMAAPIVYTTFDQYTSSWQVSPSGTLFGDGRSMDNLSFMPSIYTKSNMVKNIRFKGNIITFVSNGTQLLRITVKNSQGLIVRNIKFSYLNPSANGRHFLTSVEVEGSDCQHAEKYTFEYYSPEYMPNTNSRAIDFWGYYNGVHRQSDESLVPQMTVSIIPDNNNQGNYFHGDSLTIGCAKSRGANENYMRYGTLKKITYPTGSSDMFTYEANRIQLDNNGSDSEFHMTNYLNGQNGVYQVGGLRVVQIKSTNRNQDVCYRTFTYGENGNGSGHSPIIEDAPYFVREQQKFYPTASGDGLKDFNSRVRTYSAMPMWPITYANGASTMYSHVTEYAGTLTDNTGKTEYRYSVPGYVQYCDGINFVQDNSTKYADWKYGHMLYKIIYKKVTNSQYEAVQKIKYNYTTTNKNMGSFKVGYHNLTKTCAIPRISDTRLYDSDYYGTVHAFNVTAKLLTSQETTLYDGNHTMLTTESYSYNNENEVEVTSKEVTRGNITQSETYTYPSQLTTNSVYAEMVEKNILTPVIKTIYTRGGKYIEVERPYNKNTTGQKTFFHPSSLKIRYTPTGAYQQRYTYTYDELGNLVQTVKDGRETETYLYGYNCQYPIAEIQNATYATVRQKLTDAFVNSLRISSTMTDSQWTTLNGLRSQLSNAFTTTYRTIPLIGVSVITDPSGHETRFTYDSLGRLSSKSIMHNNTSELLEEYEYNYKDNTNEQ